MSGPISSFSRCLIGSQSSSDVIFFYTFWVPVSLFIHTGQHANVIISFTNCTWLVEYNARPFAFLSVDFSVSCFIFLWYRAASNIDLLIQIKGAPVEQKRSEDLPVAIIMPLFAASLITVRSLIVRSAPLSLTGSDTCFSHVINLIEASNGDD